jgi:hypothetical protein
MPSKGFGMIGKLVGQMPGQDKPAINALTSMGLLGAGHPLWAIGAATATLQNPKAMATMAQGVANNIPGLAEKLSTAGAQMGGGAIQQNMGETKPARANAAPTGPANAAPTTINVNHPALAPWKPVFQKNAASATNTGEAQKSQAMTDFVLSQRDPAYAAAKQKMADEPTPANPPVSQPATPPDNMAKGGVAAKKGGQFNMDMKDQLQEFLKKQKGAQ